LEKRNAKEVTVARNLSGVLVGTTFLVLHATNSSGKPANQQLDVATLKSAVAVGLRDLPKSLQWE
jgi:hypothetical protein